MPPKQKKQKKVAPAESINVDGKAMTKTAYRDMLLKQLRTATDKKDTVATKRLRSMLRTKCQHYGGLRQRTYVDKAKGNERIVVNAK